MLKVCRDCMNRAKKECVHQQCRTCCRNHGYDCLIHLKGTWVPATKRRKWQHHHDNYSQSQSKGLAFVASSSSFVPSGIAKRQRIDDASTAAAGSSASNAATPRHHLLSSGCARMIAIRDNASEIIYQTTVTISSHVSKGFLYEQGSKNAIGCTSESTFDEGERNRNRANEVSPVMDLIVLASRRLVAGE